MNPTFSPRSCARSSSVIVVRLAPSRSTEPRLGVSRPASSPSSVVFPLPDGPTIATYDPVGISKFTSRSTASWWSPLRYSFVNSLATSMSTRVWIMMAALVMAACGGSDGSRAAGDSGAVAANGATANGTTATDAVTSDRRRAVVFLGTSLTAGLGLEPEQAFPALLQQK